MIRECVPKHALKKVKDILRAGAIIQRCGKGHTLAEWKIRKAREGLIPGVIVSAGLRIPEKGMRKTNSST